jgi:hypothetical protein
MTLADQPDWKTFSRQWETRAKQSAREAARYRNRLSEVEAEPPWLGQLLVRLNRIEALLDETEWVAEPDEATPQPTTEGTHNE